MDDITDTLAPTSDQLDAVDLLGGPRTFTVVGVVRGSDEQPVQVKLDGFPRVWRPSKGMRRVLAAGWGPKTAEWTGRRVTLFCDPDVTFGREKVGGIRISHLSHIDGALRVPLLVSRGKSSVYTVREITEPTEPSEAEVAACEDRSALRDMWQRSGPARRAQIEERSRALEAADTLPGVE